MTEGERAALWRQLRVQCRANLAANERALAGSTVARGELGVGWTPVELAIRDRFAQDPGCVEPVTAQNRDCIC